MRRVTIAFAVCTLSLSTALPAAAEDLTIVSKSSLGSTTSTEYISSSVIRHSGVQDISGAPDDRIYDLVNRKLTVISRDKKEYWEQTTKELEAQYEVVMGGGDDKPTGEK